MNRDEHEKKLFEQEHMYSKKLMKLTEQKDVEIGVLQGQLDKVRKVKDDSPLRNDMQEQRIEELEEVLTQCQIEADAEITRYKSMLKIIEDQETANSATLKKQRKENRQLEEENKKLSAEITLSK